jgi:HD-GYP domain-containing protein (c-di-GMP phosphodiesterase class II)
VIIYLYGVLAEVFLKIRSQLILGIVAIVILSVTATTVVLVRDAAEIMQGQINEKALIMINYFKGVSAEPLLKDDEVTLNTYLNEIISTEGLVYLIITGRDGNVKAADDSSLLGAVLKNRLPEIAAGEKNIFLKYKGRDYSVLAFSGTVDVKAGRIKTEAGKIYAGFDSEYVKEKLIRVYVKSAAIAAGIIIISVIFIVALMHRMMNPLNKLVKGTNKIADGDLNYKIKISAGNECQELANSFNGMTDKLRDYYDGILNAFTVAVDTQDKYIPAHAKRVSKMAVKTAQAAGLSPKRAENLRVAAILKDVGNIGVKRKILDKTDPLTADDVLEIQKHPEIGAKIIKNIDALKDVVPIIIAHHERFDGNGYPDGKKGEEIPVEARILAVADAYDAMTTEREHRKALDKDEAVYELRLNKGKQFDPVITERFIEVINKEGGKA